MYRMRLVAIPLVVVMLLSASIVQAQQVAPGEADRWRSVVSALEPAAFVSVRLKDGSRFKGTVLGADASSFAIKPKTRIPVAARDVRYDEVVSIARTRQGMNPGQKVLAGTAAVVGGIFLMAAVALSNWD
jgi:hypothetical protein